MYVSLCACLVEQDFMDVGYIKHHHQTLISHSLYFVINNFVGRYTQTETIANASTQVDRRPLSLSRYVCLSVRANV